MLTYISLNRARYAMNFAALDLKKLYFNKDPKDVKIVHVMSSGLKAMFTWHSMRTLQVWVISSSPCMHSFEKLG